MHRRLSKKRWLANKINLADVKSENVQFTLSKKSLLVRGCRRDWTFAEGYNHQQRMEIAYSHFERNIELPCLINPDHVLTEFRDGMLLIRLQSQRAAS